MAYFKSNEYDPGSSCPDDDMTENEYDDGLDDLPEPEEKPLLSEEEKAERKQIRARFAFGAGNLLGVVSGAVLILVMLTLIFSIVHFMVNDLGRSFSLFQTNF